MAPKRSSGSNNSESKKCNFNMWEHKDKPSTSTNVTDKKSKTDFNIWDDENPIETIKISDLNVGKYAQKKIFFRVSFKSVMKKTKAGEMFSFHAFDGSGEIIVTIFPKDAEVFFNIIVSNRIYELINFSIKTQAKEFSIKDEKFQMILSGSSTIQEAPDHVIPEIPFNFKDIMTIQGEFFQAKVDFIGVIVKDWGIENNINDNIKRDISCTDKTKKCVLITFWGSSAESFNYPDYSIIAIRNGVVSSYDEMKSINCFSKTLTWLNPDFTNAQDLKKWFEVEIKAKSD